MTELEDKACQAAFGESPPNNGYWWNYTPKMKEHWYEQFLKAHKAFCRVLAEGDGKPIEDCGQTPLDEP